MSFTEFERLSLPPELRGIADRVDRAIERIVRLDLNAAIDEEVISVGTDLSEDGVYDMLVWLRSSGALELRFVWICPETRGASAESVELAGFGNSVDCSLCGETHFFESKRIQVIFVASDRLRERARL
jgi:hypothetical protein